MLDKRGASIQVTIEESVVWVNVDGICAVRIHDPSFVEVTGHGKDLFTFEKGDCQGEPRST